MLGSVPDFGRGAVVALVMLIPSAVSIAVLRFLEKYNIRYNRISEVELKRNRSRDTFFAVVSGVIMLSVSVNLCGYLCDTVRGRLAV